MQVASTLGDHAQSDSGESFLAPTGLRGVPWFSGCTEAELAQVAGLCERLAIEEGEVILREGRLGRELFVILSGRATVTREGTVVNALRAGDYFGELAAIEPAPRSATVTATTDLDVLVIGPREFDAIMSIPSVRNALLRGMSRRIREADDKLAHYMSDTENAQDSKGAERSR